MGHFPEKTTRPALVNIHCNRVRRASILLMFLLLGHGLACHSAEFSIGIVPQFDSRKIEEAWSPIAKEIESKSGHRFTLRGSPSIPEFETRLYKGEFDFAYMNPYHFVQAHKIQRYTALLRDHAEPLQGIIVVRTDSTLNRIEEIHGKKIAMPAPNALGAALIPRAEFARKFKIAPEILYVKSHASVYRSVVAGTVEAGGGIESTLEAESPSIKSQLRILYKTAELPTHPIAAHPRVPAAVVKQFQEIVLAYANTAEGLAQFAKAPILKIGLATTSDYKVLENMRLDEFFVK